MTSFIKAMLDLFIAISVLAAFGQDLYSMTFSKNAVSTTSSDPSIGNETLNNSTL